MIDFHTVRRAHLEDVAAFFEDGVAQAMGGIRLSSVMAFRLHEKASKAARVHWALDRDEAELAGRLAIVAKSGLAVFEGAAAPGGTITHDIGEGGPIEVPADVDPDLADLDVWFETYTAARLLRREDLLGRLVAASAKLGVPQPAPDWRLFYRRALSVLVERDFLDATALRTALEGLDMLGTSAGAAEICDVGDITLYYAIGLQSAERFEEFFQDWQERWREYFDHPDRLHDPRGLLALGTSAAAALAIDRGLQVTTPSAYTPLGLIVTVNP